MPTINQHTIHKTTYSSWCTDKGYIISNRKDIFKIWLEESKKLLLNYEYGITIENGKIRAAIVTFTYIYAIGEDDVQYFVQSESTLDFYYNNGLYSEYNGTKFTV